MSNFGMLAQRFCKKTLPLQVCRSNAGFYIGTYSEDGPCSRESVEYFRKEADAHDAMRVGNWTQRQHP